VRGQSISATTACRGVREQAVAELRGLKSQVGPELKLGLVFPLQT